MSDNRSTPDVWFAGELHYVLAAASERGLPLSAMVDTLIAVISTASYDLPTHQKAELLMRFAMRLGLDMEISVEPRPPHRPC